MLAVNRNHPKDFI